MSAAPPFQSGILKCLRKVFHGWPRPFENALPSVYAFGTGCLRLPLKIHTAAYDASSGFSLFKQYDGCSFLQFYLYQKQSTKELWLALPFQITTAIGYVVLRLSVSPLKYSRSRSNVFSGDLTRPLNMSVCPLYRIYLFENCRTQVHGCCRVPQKLLLPVHGSVPECLAQTLKSTAIRSMFPPAKLNTYQICLPLRRRKITSSKQENIRAMAGFARLKSR